MLHIIKREIYQFTSLYLVSMKSFVGNAKDWTEEMPDAPNTESNRHNQKASYM